MFAIGDHVVYPMHGVGVVESIEERTVLHETACYYVLRFVAGSMSALVPVASASIIGLRPISDASTCQEVLSYLEHGDCAEESKNWNQRYRENLDKLRRGDILSVAGVTKCLLVRDRHHGLSTGERKMLVTARQVLLQELVASSGQDESVFMPLLS